MEENWFSPSSNSHEEPRAATLLYLLHDKIASHYQAVIEEKSSRQPPPASSPAAAARPAAGLSSGKGPSRQPPAASALSAAARPAAGLNSGKGPLRQPPAASGDESGADAAGGENFEDASDDEAGAEEASIQAIVRLWTPEEAANDFSEDEIDYTYPEFEGKEASAEHFEYMRRRNMEFTRREKRHRNKRARTLAEAQLALHKGEEASWAPPCLHEVVDPCVGATIRFRHECERNGRANCAMLGLQNGVKVRQDHESVKIRCGNKDFKSEIRYSYQPSSTLWKCTTFVSSHLEACRGAPTPSDSPAGAAPLKYPVPAYMARQVAQLILHDLRKYPNLNTRAVAEKVQTLGIFSRDPRPEYFGQVLSAAAKYAVAKRAVEMAAIGRYAELFNACGHEVRLCLVPLL